MFSLPALFAALFVAFAVFGGVAGALWLFVYGDEVWPPLAEHALVALFVLTAAGSWLMLMWAAYAFGRRAEESESLHRGHVLGAALATIALPLVAVLHQWNVGNLGAPSDGAACMDYCRGKGFNASAMPPRDSGKQTCSCLDARGREAVTVPMAEIR